jgi:anti-repressor protein
MQDLIPITYTSDRPTVSGRALHAALEVKTPYSKWFPRMTEYGFTEGSDFATVDKIVRRADGVEMPQTQHDHQLTLDMAKELCMIQRTDKGKECRQYFIAAERQWNSPEAVMARALQLANRTLEEATGRVKRLEAKVEADKPKVLFADSVAASSSSCLVGDLAKILRQNGVETGQKRLFQTLRDDGFLMKGGSSYNLPTQRAMEMGLFEVKETTITHSDGHITVNRTTKVTGKGQVYFVSRYRKRGEQDGEKKSG